MFFATIEYLLPKPLPFLRLGLANIPILASLRLLHPREVALVALLKVLGQALVNGTLASYVFLFSVAGTFASTALMLLVSRLSPRLISLIGVSLVGSLTANAAQVALSVAFVFGAASVVMVPIFLVVGLVSGIVVGVIAEVFTARSVWFATLRGRMREG